MCYYEGVKKNIVHSHRTQGIVVGTQLPIGSNKGLPGSDVSMMRLQ